MVNDMGLALRDVWERSLHSIWVHILSRMSRLASVLRMTIFSRSLSCVNICGKLKIRWTNVLKPFLEFLLCLLQEEHISPNQRVKQFRIIENMVVKTLSWLQKENIGLCNRMAVKHKQGGLASGTRNQPQWDTVLSCCSYSWRDPKQETLCILE